MSLVVAAVFLLIGQCKSRRHHNNMRFHIISIAPYASAASAQPTHAMASVHCSIGPHHT